MGVTHTHTQALFLHQCCMRGGNKRPLNTQQPIAQLDGPGESSLCIREHSPMEHDDVTDLIDPTSGAVDLPVDSSRAVENVSRPAS